MTWVAAVLLLVGLIVGLAVGLYVGYGMGGRDEARLQIEVQLANRPTPWQRDRPADGGIAPIAPIDECMPDVVVDAEGTRRNLERWRNLTSQEAMTRAAQGLPPCP